MLNPPLSTLSDDLLACIVEHVAKLPGRRTDLYYLSLTDWAFTRSCQVHMFEDLCFGYCSRKKKNILRKLAWIQKLLDYNPLYANSVCNLYLTLSHNDNAWLFNDPTFIGIVQLLAKSPVPPHKLGIYRYMHVLTLEDPTLVVMQLTQLFFSKTLTTLHLIQCNNIPLALFLVCPKLREVRLEQVHMTKRSDAARLPEEHYDREPPALEHLVYCDLERLIEQMLMPLPQRPTGAICWSNLCTLMLELSNLEEMPCLQHIIDASCSTLEELYLNKLPKYWRKNSNRMSPPVPMMDLSKLSQLHIFSLSAAIRYDCNAPKFAVIHNINTILHTIPATNKITSLFLDFSVIDVLPFSGLHREDWGGLCSEVVRISAQKPLELNVKAMVAANFEFPTAWLKQLFSHISWGLASLSKYPHIFLLLGSLS